MRKLSELGQGSSSLSAWGLLWRAGGGAAPGPAKTQSLGGAWHCHLLREIQKGLYYPHSDRRYTETLMLPK